MVDGWASDDVAPSAEQADVGMWVADEGYRVRRGKLVSAGRDHHRVEPPRGRKGSFVERFRRLHTDHSSDADTWDRDAWLADVVDYANAFGLLWPTRGVLPQSEDLDVWISEASRVDAILRGMETVAALDSPKHRESALRTIEFSPKDGRAGLMDQNGDLLVGMHLPQARRSWSYAEWRDALWTQLQGQVTGRLYGRLYVQIPERGRGLVYSPTSLGAAIYFQLALRLGGRQGPPHKCQGCGWPTYRPKWCSDECGSAARMRAMRQRRAAQG
jgi:hypothetical protein